MPCPQNREIQKFLSGELEDEQRRQFAEHLDTCQTCQDALGALCGDDSSASILESTPGSDPRQDGSQLDRVIDQLKRLVPDESEKPEVEEELRLDFLKPPRTPDYLGQFDSYDVLELIGHGGMGIVLKAHEPKLDRILAIKVLSPSLAADARARKRFLREGRATAAVSHDHVVAIHAVGETEGLPYLVMEYVTGCSLQDRIETEGSMPVEDILRISQQSASGLTAAHAQGLIHRDIKPANILLENRVERVKITDFGLARSSDDVQMTRSGVVTGTPEYMSPEQAAGKAVDARTDLFGLGGVMYAMCTGRPPVAAKGLLDAIRKVCDETPPDIRRIEPATPGWVVEIVEKLLAKDADQRFQSASEVADLLEQHLAHLRQPNVVPQPPPPASPTRPRKSRWRPWRIVAAGLLALCVGLTLTEATRVTTIGTYLATVLGIRPRNGAPLERINDPEGQAAVELLPLPTGSIDLLDLIDPQRDSINPSWTMDGPALVSSGERALLQIPFVLPKEYDLELVAQRLTGVDCLSLGMVIGDRQATVNLDGFGTQYGNMAALNEIDGQWGPPNETATFSTTFSKGESVRITVAVRTSGVRVTRNRETLIDWHGSSDRLSLRPFWSPRHGNCLFLASHKSSFKITRLALHPVTGKGRQLFLAEPPANVDRAAAERVLWEGGRVSVAVDGSSSEIHRLVDLPASLCLLEVALRGKKPGTSVDLASLLRLDNLQRLDLVNTSIRDADLDDLQADSKLAELDLSLTPVTDAGLKSLPQACPGLRRLGLSGTSVSDEGISCLVGMTKLEELNLAGTRISDSGLAALEKLGGINRLVLDHTAISDGGLVHLKDLPNLQYVSLTATQVSDTGLEHLRDLDRLKGICLFATRVSDDGFAGLEQALPECIVDGDTRQSVDLLSLVEPSRDAVLGQWRRESDAVVSPTGRFNRLEIPHPIPEAYGLELVVARRSGDEGFMVGLVAGKQQVVLVVDEGWGRGTSLARIDGTTGHQTETARSTNVFAGLEPVRILVTVRDSHITAACARRVLIDWRGDFRRLSIISDWATPDENRLFLGSFETSFRFSKMRLVPLSAAGVANGSSEPIRDRRGDPPREGRPPGP